MPQKTYDTYIQRVHRQHCSLVVTFPYLLAQRQGIVAGDYLLFEGDEDSEFVKVSKVVHKGRQNGTSKKRTGRRDRSRHARAPRKRH